MENLKTTKGLILGVSSDGEPITTDFKNIIVFGNSGTGKTTSFLEPNILNAIAQEHSIIVADTKGEIYEKTVSAAEKQGYRIKMLNLRDPDKSDKWNPLTRIINNPDQARVLATQISSSIIENTFKGSYGDIFFNKAEESLLEALVLYVALSPSFTGKRDLCSVYKLLERIVSNEGKCEELNKLDDDDPALAKWKLFLGSGRLRMNFAVGLALRLKSLQDEKFKKIFTGSDIDLDDLDKTIVYITYPITDEETRPYTSIFLNQAFGALLHKNVSFFLDEFHSLGKISNLDHIMKEHENLSTCLILLDSHQLRETYGEISKRILDSCPLLCFGTLNKETALLFDEEHPEKIMVSCLEQTPSVFYRHIARCQKITPFFWRK